tara:strand:+ start:367 stop:720 length:354 start_codon:yes stop_codon:yes gene_type:complete
MDHEVYAIIEESIDDAFLAFRFRLNLYDYFNVIKATRKDADDFINSNTFKEIKDLVLELDEYLKGGQDNEHKQLREAYGHIPKPQARKIKQFLEGILEDAVKYSYDKRPGRRKKPSK